ncbi:MAG: hypothetical protein AAFO01_21055 [Pseudomonadota bacterium]
MAGDAGGEAVYDIHFRDAQCSVERIAGDAFREAIRHDRVHERQLASRTCPMGLSTLLTA